MALKVMNYLPLAAEDEPDHLTTAQFYQVPRTTLTNRTLVLLLVFSSIGHLLWPIVIYLQHKPHNSCGREKSPYAGLSYEVPVPFRDDSTFLHRNSAVADATWDSWTIEPGIVALPHDFVNEKMLPQAQASPLDKSKGVYVLSSYHSLHCLKKLRDSFVQQALGVPRLEGTNFDHDLHCFEFLRSEIICHADDTPRYTGFSEGEMPGMMQVRMCRSWDKLEEWARVHTACYRDPSQDISGFPHLNFTTHCPKGYIYSADGSPISPWVTGTGVPQVGD